MKNVILLSFIFLSSLSAQVPAPAYNPMTAPGAIGISYFSHTLFWQNPVDIDYNECYFSSDSSLVANLDPSVRLLNGNPATVYDSLNLNALEINTTYYWRIVEYNSSGNNPSPVWYFNTCPSPMFGYEFTFDNNWDGWEFFGPAGINNWDWSNSSVAGSTPGEMVFRWDPVFVGDSYIMSPEIPAPVGASAGISFLFYEDWWSDTVVVGCAVTSDNGNTWTTLWDLYATGNVGPSIENIQFQTPGNFRLGFFYTGDSNNIDFFYVDYIGVGTALTVSFPPSLLEAEAISDEQKIMLNWNSGSSPDQIIGYYIQRKKGLPQDTSSYVYLGETDANTFTFSDETVELDEVYTYRICTRSGPGWLSHYGNEATAYVPEIVPVELVSFSANVEMNNVKLIWITASETNNIGFEIERSEKSKVKNQKWEKIGFKKGKGTTTKQQFYSFVDKNLNSGKYHYRLKQIDFDGTFEYSNVIEAKVNVLYEFSLSQNYPNPFNATTKIKYTIPPDERRETKNVMLKVYDVLGNEVSTLVNEEKQSGVYEVEFGASHLSSGMYIYTLKAGNYSASRKMMILK